MNTKHLTPHQKDVHKLMLTRMDYDEMAVYLEVARGTVNFHVNRVLELMGHSSRIELLCEHHEDRNTQARHLGFLKKLSEFDRHVATFAYKGYKVGQTASMLEATVADVRYARRKVFKAAAVKNSLELVYKVYGVK